MSDIPKKNYPFKTEDVFHTLNANEAEDYIQTAGYFGSSLELLTKAIFGKEKHILTCVEDETYGHRFMSDEEDHYHYQFFLPEDKVVELKEYRPFQSIVEFCSAMCLPESIGPIGLILTLRHKESQETYRIQVAGFSQKKLVIPVFGCLSFFNLFKNWELMHNSTEFTPFGVLATEPEEQTGIKL